MAEIVGAVASGISIGTLVMGITSSIVKLKHYFDQVHEAPEDIMELIEQLKLLSLVLADMEENQRRNHTYGLIPDSKSLSQCLQLYKQGIEPLRDLTVSLSADLDTANKVRRKWGSAKVVLKKTQLDRYRVKLERAIKLLAFSHQMYTRYVRLSCPCMTSQGPRTIRSLLHSPLQNSSAHLKCANARSDQSSSLYHPLANPRSPRSTT